MTASLKMRQLASKIAELQKQYQHHLKQRQQDIASLITTLDLASFEDNILIGGLMYLKDKITTEDSIVEGWRDAGDRFLRRRTPKRTSTLKTIATSLTPHQSAPKQPESREK
jgi:hypothetical protein